MADTEHSDIDYRDPEVQRRLMRELLLSEPTILIFYYPLRWPLGLEDKRRYAFALHQNLNWPSDLDWNPGVREQMSSPDQLFVHLKVYRAPHVETIDTQPVEAIQNIIQELWPGQRVDQEEAASHGISYGNVPPPQSETPSTIIQMSTPAVELPDDQFDLVTSAFNRCLNHLNMLESAYMITSQDAKVQLTTLLSAPPLIRTLAVRAASDEIVYDGLLLLGKGLADLPYEVADLSSESLDELHVRIELRRIGFPLALVTEKLALAKRSSEILGDHAGSFLGYYTAGEMYLDSLLLVMAWEEPTLKRPGSLAPDLVASWFGSNSSLVSRLRSSYHSRLNGDWDLTLPDTALHTWTDDVYRIRNKMVHSGYVPTVGEIQLVRDTFDDITIFVRERLTDRANIGKYPATAILFVSAPRLLREGNLTRRMQSLLEDSQLDLFESFMSFHGQVVKLL